MKSLFSSLNAVVAISAGLIVLMGYFLPGLGFLRLTLLEWASILAAFALLTGVINLFSVHWRRIFSRQSGKFSSLALLLSLISTILIVGLSGLDSELSRWIFTYIQMPLEKSLLALLAVILAYTCMVMLRRRRSPVTLLFLSVVLLTLLASTPIYLIGEINALRSFGEWLEQTPAAAGVRGLLLGVALGTIATGLRVLLGADRPYGG